MTSITLTIETDTPTHVSFAIFEALQGAVDTGVEEIHLDILTKLLVASLADDSQRRVDHDRRVRTAREGDIIRHAVQAGQTGGVSTANVEAVGARIAGMIVEALRAPGQYDSARFDEGAVKHPSK